jgi:hypothetical protein
MALKSLAIWRIAGLYFAERQTCGLSQRRDPLYRTRTS